MNASERLEKRLNGMAVDRPPNFNIFMTFAAHFINHPLSKYYLDHHVLVEANLAMVEHFKVDLVQAISDPYRETYDFGAHIEFPEDGLPVSDIPLLDSPEKLRTLKRPNSAEGKRMSDRLEAIRLFRDQVGDEIPVMGWVEGALAEAGDLRGITSVLMDIYERPEWLEELLEIIVEVEIEFARSQIEAGATIIGLGDAIASQISPEAYRTYALSYEQRIFDAVHDLGALARLHICGNTTAIIGDMVKSGADIIDLDWMVDMKEASHRYGGEVAFCGNMDPVALMLQGNTDQIYHATQKCILDGGNNCISAAGCEIPDGTPDENLKAQYRALVEV